MIDVKCIKGNIDISMFGSTSEIVSELGCIILEVFKLLNFNSDKERALTFTANMMAVSDTFFERLENSPDESLKTETKQGI